jgi:hypothetical protein
MSLLIIQCTIYQPNRRQISPKTSASRTQIAVSRRSGVLLRSGLPCETFLGETEIALVGVTTVGGDADRGSASSAAARTAEGEMGDSTAAVLSADARFGAGSGRSSRLVCSQWGQTHPLDLTTVT